ncbi:MAG: hypothetical protein MJA29_13850 [Candidatus Omnitrophica bacterium]|nr:hypothetical protein [Candidatus Omnitrophota bacterium]
MSNKLIEELLDKDRKRLERLYAFIMRGVDIVDPFTTHIAEGVRIGKGTVIYPMTVIEARVHIGKNCRIGPFARIRQGVKMKDKVTVGNFVEVVRSTLSSGAKVKHLTYVGDTEVGENVNIGAGTVVANYDGSSKHKTRIRKGAFIGSGSILVAPVVVGKDAVTGAGAVVTKKHNVPDKAVVIGVPARMLKKG